MHLQILEFSIKFTFPKLIKTTGPSWKIKCEVDEVTVNCGKNAIHIKSSGEKAYVLFIAIGLLAVH